MNESEEQEKINSKKEYLLIITTVNNADEAVKLSELLVKEQAAACVSISSPVTSVYTWKGNVETEKEVMMFIKTVKENYKNVEKLILENHSYEVPEIIALPVTGGEEKYLQWVSNGSAPPADRP